MGFGTSGRSFGQWVLGFGTFVKNYFPVKVGFGFWVLGFETVQSRSMGFGFWKWVLGFESGFLGFEISNGQVHPVAHLASGFWVLGVGFWVLGFGTFVKNYFPVGVKDV